MNRPEKEQSLISANEFFREFEHALIYMMGRGRGVEIFKPRTPADFQHLQVVTGSALNIKLDVTMRLQEAAVAAKIPVYGLQKQKFDSHTNPLINEITNQPLHYLNSDLKIVFVEKLKNDRVVFASTCSPSMIDEMFAGLEKAFDLAVEQCLPVLADNLVICNDYKSFGLGPSDEGNGSRPQSHVIARWQNDVVAGFIPNENFASRQSYKNRGPFI